MKTATLATKSFSVVCVGGITIAQTPDTAAEPGSAIAGGWGDFVLTPEEIAGKIAEIAGAVSPDRRRRATSTKRRSS